MFEFQPSNDGKLPGDARVVFVFILLIIVILLRLAGRSNAYCRRYHLMTDCIKENWIQSRECRILPRGIVLKKNLGKNTWSLSQDLVCTYQSLLSLSLFSLSLFSASYNKSAQAQQSNDSKSDKDCLDLHLLSDHLFLPFFRCRIPFLSFQFFHNIIIFIYPFFPIIPNQTILALEKFSQLRTSFKFRRSATFTPNLVSTSDPTPHRAHPTGYQTHNMMSVLNT